MLLKIGIAMLGIVIGIPLMAMWRSRPANLWLGLFVSSISLLAFADYFARDPAMFGVFDWPLAAFGTFYYFYVRGVIGLKNRAVDFLHFVPSVLFVGFIIWIRVNVPGWSRVQAGPLQHAFLMAVLAVQALCFGYILLVFHLLRRHRRHVRACFSSTAQRDLNWLTWLTAVLILNLVLWAIVIQQKAQKEWVLAGQLGQLAMLYFVAWYGTRQVAIFQDQLTPAAGDAASAPVPVAPPAMPAASESAITTGPDITVDKYARSGMTDAASDLIGKRLLSRMTDSHDYLDNDITLATLAERIGTSPQLVSQYLNHVLKVSFFDYINGFRVAAVERRLQDPASEGMTLVDVALACGFNSKSTFNAAFKRVHGVAPSVWRSQQAKAAVPAQ